ncbi:MAG: bifunctional protein GlmU [Candidatus Binatia bacterium]|nr:MAG: bifunctional protein GlmU [Candidatus Binatia bacterium]
MSPSRPIAALLLAAGKSTRMRSARPKAVHSLCGRPLLAYPLSALRGLGIDRAIVVVGWHAEQVVEVAEAWSELPVGFAVQEEPRGTGHAALCGIRALEGFEGEVLVLNGDLPLLSGSTLRRLLERHLAEEAVLTVLTAELDDPSGYGRIVRDGGAVLRVVEEKDATEAQRRIREVNVGVYCARCEFLRTALVDLRPDNVQGELYLTDLVGAAAERGLRVVAVPAAPEEVAQVNTREELAKMEEHLRERIVRSWMDRGVTFLDPRTAYVEADVTIGPDTTVGPNVQLRGKTTVGARCRIDGTAYLENASVGDDVRLRFGVVVVDSEIGASCEVGPFAHVRAGSVLEEGAIVGNFVETKKTRLGRRSKARHLAYLGDSEIGEDTNVGAGTITCNYDGFRKHRTRIGSRVMIGSDSQLVAPVSVGDDAYVATGTTVRHDVPPGALVYNPKTEKHRQGWVEARRRREKSEDEDS